VPLPFSKAAFYFPDLKRSRSLGKQICSEKAKFENLEQVFSRLPGS
jgi:hypothetical protein